MRKLLWPLITVGIVLGAACSSTDDGGSSGAPSGDASTPTDAASTIDGAATDGLAPRDDAASQDSAVDSGPTDGGGDEDANVAPGTFTLTSTAFAAGAAIPAIHSLLAGNDSPPLVWSGAPAGTLSYAIVVRDISLVGANYHWVIYDIPAATTSLPQDVDKAAAPAQPAGAKQTYWSFGASTGYQGPNPPSEHNYQFTVYSFATATITPPADLTSPASADTVIQAAKTGSASLTGKFQN
jgi:hypothetical protein